MSDRPVPVSSHQGATVLAPPPQDVFPESAHALGSRPGGAVRVTGTSSAVRHEPTLAGLRGLAVLLVLAFHFRLIEPTSGGYGIAAASLRAGWIGVDLFFVLSGFLITAILLESRHHSAHFFRNFYVRRALRLFPIYYAFLFGTLIVAPMILTVESPELRGVIDHQTWFWLYVQNYYVAATGSFIGAGFNHFWTLAMEEQFYILWPLLVYFVAPRGVAWTCLAIVGVAVACRAAALVTHVGPETIYVLTPTRMDTLAIGSLIGALRYTRNGDNVLVRWRIPVFLASAGALLAIVLVDDGLYWNSPRVQAVGFTAIALLWGTILTGAVVQPKWAVLPRVVSAPWLQTVGKYSYAIYVFHFPMNFWARKHLDLLPFTNLLLRQLTYAAVMTAASVGVALLSWHLLEKRCLELKSYFPR